MGVFGAQGRVDPPVLGASTRRCPGRIDPPPSHPTPPRPAPAARLAAVRRLAPSRPWYVRVLDSTSILKPIKNNKHDHSKPDANIKRAQMHFVFGSMGRLLAPSQLNMEAALGVFSESQTDRGNMVSETRSPHSRESAIDPGFIRGNVGVHVLPWLDEGPPLICFRTCRTQSPDIPRAGRGGAAHSDVAERGGSERGVAGRGGTAVGRCAQETTVYLAPRHRKQTSWMSLRRHEQTKSYGNRIAEHNERLTRGLSAGPDALFVPGC